MAVQNWRFTDTLVCMYIYTQIRLYRQIILQPLLEKSHFTEYSAQTTRIVIWKKNISEVENFLTSQTALKTFPTVRSHVAAHTICLDLKLVVTHVYVCRHITNCNNNNHNYSFVFTIQ